MFTIGIQRAMELGIDRDMVSFEIGDATKRDYKAESFHVVYCRDMILHIEDKISLLKRFYVSNCHCLWSDVNENLNLHCRYAET